LEAKNGANRARRGRVVARGPSLIPELS